MRARLPRVPDLDQPVVAPCPLPVQVLVPRDELRHQRTEETARVVAVAGVAIDVPDRRRMERRLHDPRRLGLLRGARGKLGSPELRPREVARVFCEPDVRQQAVRPLSREDPLELGLRSLLVPARVPDRDARRVPAPLVWVEVGGRAGRVSHPVPLEDCHRPLREVAVRSRQARSSLRLEPTPRRARELGRLHFAILEYQVVEHQSMGAQAHRDGRNCVDRRRQLLPSDAVIGASRRPPRAEPRRPRAAPADP